MISDEVASSFDAQRVAEGRWRGKCPAHDGKSHNSLSVRSTSDGKTLLKCFAGCSTEEVLNAADLGWSDLFPPSSASHPHRQIDPEIALRRKVEKVLLEWRGKASRIIGYSLWLRHRLIAKAEQLIDNGGTELGWDLMELGYLGLSRLTWLGDLIDSKHRDDWERARKFLGVEL